MKLSRTEFIETWQGRKAHLKIGIDAGQTVLRMAKYYPNELFVGIEKKQDKAKVAIEKAKAKSQKNVLIRAAEAHNFLRKMPIQSFFHVAHIYFPTPKKVRRHGEVVNVQQPLITPSFLNELSTKLVTGATVRILTDRDDYFEDIQNSVSLETWWPQSWTDFPCGQNDGEFIGTPCERRYRADGREIYALQLKKMM